MAEMKPRVLIHSGDEFVGSVEPESLQLLTYLRLAGAERTVDISTTCKPWQAPPGGFPALLADTTSSHSLLYPSATCCGTVAVISYLKRSHGVDLDAHLSDQQLAEAAAYSALLTDKLKPAMLFLHWLDSKNYLEVTRQWYSSAAVFPFTLFALSWQHRKVQQCLHGDQQASESMPDQKIELISNAESCLTHLSVRLGVEQYFCGSRPCSLDAMVFGYLELILQYNLPGDNSLQQKMNSLPNLVKFCERIRRSVYQDKKLRPLHISSHSSLLSGPFWREPAVWACAGVSVLVLVLQGMRVGLFHRLWRRRSTPVVTAPRIIDTISVD